MAIFLSGSGSNAEKLLNDQAVRSAAEAVVLITDAPEKSRAGIIGSQYNIPVIEFSIREFYRQNGLNTISLATEAGRRVREMWTGELRKMLQPYRIDFGVLAGFEPLSNITEDFPCLNVHPGDLTVTDADGSRCYIGLHTVPVEKAILAGEKSLRSSVIMALPFTEPGQDMDNGLLLGISGNMPIDFGSLSLDALRNVKAARCGKKPAGGWQDELEKLASRSQEQLKVHGDHRILPVVVRDFASGCFAVKDGVLYYRRSRGEKFQTAGSGEYDNGGLRKL